MGTMKGVGLIVKDRDHFRGIRIDALDHRGVIC